MHNSTIYPWQHQQWQILWRCRQEHRLPHAMLFIGNAGIGKTDFVGHFAQALLCSNVDTQGFACQECHDCHLVRAQTHPALQRIEPEKVGQAIKIDQIREVTEFAQQTTLQGKYRIVIINPAGAMNAHAANALLKTLEEPTPNTFIILLAEQNTHLPATILSRCQRFAFPQPDTELALEWLNTKIDDPITAPLLLKLSDGSPLQSLRYAEGNVLILRKELHEALFLLSKKQGDPIKYAAKWQDVDVLQTLNFVFTWINDVARLRLNAEKKHLINEDDYENLYALSQSISIKSITQYLNQLQHLRAELLKGMNLNKQLLLESLFIDWRAIASCS